MASLYAPRLAELARAYEKKGVAFFGVDCQPAGRPLGAVAVRQGARPAVPAAEGRGQRAGRPAGRRADARGLRPGRGPGRALSRPGGRPVRLRRPPPVADPPRPRRGARRPARRPAGGHAADRARRLPDRPGREGRGGCDRHLLEAGGPHPPRPLRRLPPRGGDRPVLADDVPAGRRLGRDDRRGRAGRPDAPLARQPRARLVRQRGPAEPTTRSGRSPPGSPPAPPRATRATCPSRRITSRAGASPRPTWSSPCPRTVKIPAEGTMPYRELHDRPEAQAGRLGAGVAGAAGEPVGGPSPGRLRAPAGQPRRRAEDRLPGRPTRPGCRPASCPRAWPGSSRPARG